MQCTVVAGPHAIQCRDDEVSPYSTTFLAHVWLCLTLFNERTCDLSLSAKPHAIHSSAMPVQLSSQVYNWLSNHNDNNVHKSRHQQVTVPGCMPPLGRKA
jgi:hypothetical protein